MLTTRDGVIHVFYLGFKQWKWKGVNPTDEAQSDMWTTRSRNHGATWSEPQMIFKGYTGASNGAIETRDGHLIVPYSHYVNDPGRLVSQASVSTDGGKTWSLSHNIDIGGAGDHEGALEPCVIELKDGRVWMLIRTTRKFFWESFSTDGGKTWSEAKATTIDATSAPGHLTRLADGRIALLWNAPPRHNPSNGSSRAELSLAFSSDETASWSKPVIVAANYAPAGRVSYPYLYERQPGELWITTMQGGLRMSVATADLAAGEIPIFVPPPKTVPKPGGIFMFGDSTTAPRGSVKVYADRVNTMLQSIGSSLSVYNAGVPSNTTVQALKRLQTDVLAYKPRIVVMQFGLNDCAIDVWKKPPATEPRVSKEAFIANYRSMIAATQKAGAKVILMTTNPLRWHSKTRELYGKPPYKPDAEDGFESPTLLAYNEALRALAKELNVPLVDVHAAYPAFAAKKKTFITDMLPDGMHPGDLGHELVAELLLPVIRSQLR